ncbi:MAG TPA: hypothetical protein VMW16_15820 [Sedimentisphaerales bacterium]|nr:hypothetical protein [Sedimentisphaerales bacterium]
MIMKTYWWKTAGVGFVVLSAVILPAVFRSRQQATKTDSPARAQAQQTQQDRPKPSAEELYRTALLHKEPGDSPAGNYTIPADCCRQTSEVQK